MISLNNESILKYFKEVLKEGEYQQQTNQVFSKLYVEKMEYPIFARIDESKTILQLLVFLPCSMRPTAAPEVGRLLHLLNREIDIPGFGMEENVGIIFFRTTLITANKKIDRSILDNLLKAVPNLVHNFFPIISAVAMEGVYFEAIAPDVKKALQQLAKR